MAISLQTVSTITGVLKKAAPALEGRIVYSTSTAASRPTMFDAFVKLCSKTTLHKKAQENWSIAQNLYYRNLKKPHKKF